MNLTVFLTALVASSVFTTLIVQAIKAMLGEKAPKSNLLAACVSIFTGVAISIGYGVYTAVPVTPQSVITAVALVILSWLCAMVGYDKVVQAIKQVIGKE